MFAVPGWNVSAAVKTQVEAPKPKDPNKLGKKAQKRKLKAEEQVNAQNVGEIWQRIIEGKVASNGDSHGVPHEGVEDKPLLAEGFEEKRGKKRKRKTNSKGNESLGESESMESKKTAVVIQGEEVAAQDAATKITLVSAESKREKKKRKKAVQHEAAADSTEALPTTTNPLLPTLPSSLTPLQRSMRAKLASARFRHLNESLYTKPSAESLSLFTADPTMFEDYHRGFAQQVDVWPENPVDGYVASVLARGKVRVRDPWKEKKRAEKKGKGKKGGEGHDQEHEPAQPGQSTAKLTGDAKPLPRAATGQCTIADLGCGTASFSHRLQPHLKSLKLAIHSFDLSLPTGPSAPLVTVSDIASLPLHSGSVDIAVFCLALMGTNWLQFIDEAWRILRWRGELWVAEIKSRFGRVTKRSGAPINSVGSLRKGTGPMGKNGKAKGKKKTEQDADAPDSSDEAHLAHAVDGGPSTADTQPGQGTDVSLFIAVLAKHGFVLDAPPEKPGDAVDACNKMFVKMRFLKSGQPTRGKNVREGEKEGGGNGGGGLRMGMKGKKFGVVKNGAEKDDDDGQDGKVLKPCLYKIR